MRKNYVQQLKQKHMHDFKRKMVDMILKDRESLPDYNKKGVSATARRGSAISSQAGGYTAAQTQQSTDRPNDSPTMS